MLAMKQKYLATLVHDVQHSFLGTSLSVSFELQGAPSQWSAHRVRANYDDKFDAIKAAKEGHPVFFTGEVSMISFFNNIN